MSALDLPGLSAVRPADVQQYLRHSGWQPIASRRAEKLFFSRQLNGHGEVRVELLLDATLSDYDRRTAELLDVLARIEDRPARLVLSDLLVPPADIYRFHIESEELQSGTVAVDDSNRIRQGIKQLFLSGAHSAVEAKAYYPRLAYARAQEFLASCREGQTERGSYVAPIIVPVPPEIAGMELVPGADPFSRKVTRLVITALSKAAELVTIGEHRELLQHAGLGLSANFLSAISLLRPPGRDSQVTIDVSWSRARTAPNIPVRRARFEEGVFTVLAEASRALRDVSAAPGVEIVGFVVRLERQNANDPGKVTVATELEGRPGRTRIHLNLNGPDYQRAWDAHSSGKLVRAIGTLKREGRNLWLENPTGLELIEPPQEDADDELPF